MSTNERMGAQAVPDDEEAWGAESGLTPIRESRVFKPIAVSDEPGIPRRRILPRHGYLIASDYIQLDDDTWMSVLDFIHDDGVEENWNTFWPLARIPKIPMEKSDQVEFVFVDSLDRKSPTWVDHHLRSAGGAVDMAKGEVDSKAVSSGDTTAHKVRRSVSDMDIITREIQSNAAYLQVQMRLIVKANSLNALDRAIRAVNRQYDDRFETLRVIAADGEQEPRLREIVGVPPEDMGGKSVYFTSTELGGAYELMTHGLRDPGGEYVGQMYGDYNNSTVLIDFERTRDDTIIAMNGRAEETEDWKRLHPDQPTNSMNLGHLWGVKIAQSAVLHGHRTVVFGLDETDVSAIGMPLRNLTTRVDVSQGDVNMFEMFDPPINGAEHMDPAEFERRRLANLPLVYSSQMGKLQTMTRMMASDDSVNSITDAALTKVLTLFYKDQRMVVDDMKNHLQDLRMTRIPHGEVPQLSMFVNYLDSELDALRRSRTTDPSLLQTYNYLYGMYRNMLDKDGDLFNTTTNDDVDRVRRSNRVIYDFSRLLGRGANTAMAELVNVFDYAVATLRAEDTIIIHGVETLTEDARAYIAGKQAELKRRGIHIVYIYTNGPDGALEQSDFNHIAGSGMTIFGTMTADNVARYEQLKGQAMPQDLKRDIMSDQSTGLCYVHRGIDNVLFVQDLLLGYNINRSDRRRRILGSDTIHTFDAVSHN